MKIFENVYISFTMNVCHSCKYNSRFATHEMHSDTTRLLFYIYINVSCDPCTLLHWISDRYTSLRICKQIQNSRSVQNVH